MADTEQRQGIVVATYDAAKCFQIVTGVAEGEKSLKDLCKEHGVSRPTFYRWMSMHSELRSAYLAAREVSAGEFEDKALAIAKKLETDATITAARVTAYRAAMEQYRWSASHRDPNAYGQTNTINIAVPVTITTPLDLGNGQTPTMPVTATSENIYQITAMVDREDDPVDTTPPGTDPLDTTAEAPAFVPKGKPGRQPKPGPDRQKTETRAARYAARKNLHPRAREILEQRQKDKANGIA